MEQKARTSYSKLSTPPGAAGAVDGTSKPHQQHELTKQETFNSDSSSRVSRASQASSTGTDTAHDVDLTHEFEYELQPMPSRRPRPDGGGHGGGGGVNHRLTATGTASHSQYKPSFNMYDQNEYGASNERATAVSYVEETLRSMHKSQAVAPEHMTVQFNATSQQPQKPLPRKYLNGKFKLNSYFAIRLVRIVEIIVVLDVVGLVFYYGYKRDEEFKDGSLYVQNPIHRVFSRDQGCRPTVALAALMYHLFPASIILGLPASGFRVFEPFKREQRIDNAGRLQKVKRTFFLQFCEVTGVIMFLYTGSIAVMFLFFLTSGRLFKECNGHSAAYLFCAGAMFIYWITFMQIRYFARFREHLKMQLGAFKESDQTGDIKAHMLRSKLRRRQQHQLRQHLKAGTDGTAASAPPPPKRSAIVADIKKRLFRGAQLGDLRLLRRSLRIAKATLGPDFAKELYPDAKMALWMFGFAKKNPMHVAAYQGNIAAMELLYRARFAVNAYDKVSRVRFSTGDLFWYLASYFIRKPVVSAEETHSSIFKTTLVTPLHCAVSTGRVDAVRWLLEHGADVNLCSKSTYRYESRLPPIFLADHPDIVRELLIAGANHLAIPDPGHMNTITVLQLAYLRHNYAVAQVLEDWGGDVALTPLHTVAAMNDTNKIRYFLRKKVDPDCLGELGYIGLNKRTPLHWAAVNGAVDAVELLLASKADANAQDARGRTPLHWAARVNRLDVVHVLLAHGADPNIVDDSDMTPILCAACAGGTTADMFKAITSRGGDINHQLRSTGDTALHIAVKLDDQQTALAILSLGGDIMRTNNDGFRPIDCTTSTRLQFEIKRAAGTRDVMISYTHSHTEFALKLRKSLEDSNVTTWLDLMDPSGIGGGAVWREEIARGITNAAVVLCVITDDYSQSEWCLKELALAKQVGTPILAISTENTKISEELQVYLYTRQIIPFEPAITTIEKANEKEILYEYDEDAYKKQVRILLDGLRDEIEKRKEDNIRKIIRRAGTDTTNNQSMHSSANARSHGGLLKTHSAASSNGTNLFNTMQFDERSLADTTMDNSIYDSVRSVTGGGIYGALEIAGSSRSMHDFTNLGAHRAQRSVRNGGSRKNIGSGRDVGGGYSNFDMGGGSLSRVSSASSMNDDFTDTGGSNIISNSIVLDKGGYYFHRPEQPGDASSASTGNNNNTMALQDIRETSGSILETFQELESATAGGEQFVFICHGDQHGRFVKKLCIDLCRDGGFRCYLDHRNRLQKLPSKIDEGNEESEHSSSSGPSDDGMSRRILEAKEAILKCSAFVVVLSEKTLTSQLVKDQLAFAEDKGKRIIPVVVNRLDFGLDMKYSLSRSDFYHFFSKGDMMGFEKSFERLLDSLREEVYGITVDNYQLPKFSSMDQQSSYAGSSRGGDMDERSGVHDSFISVSSSHSLLNTYSSANGFPGSVRRRRLSTQSMSMNSDRGGGEYLSSFGVPSSRPSQSFIGSSSFIIPSSAGTSATSSSRGISSDMSLSQAMIGNFSSLMGRISDDLDEEAFDGLSYAGVQGGDDDDGSDDENNDSDLEQKEPVMNENPGLNHFVNINNVIEPKSRRNSASSISILERKSDEVTMSIDAMDTSNL